MVPLGFAAYMSEASLKNRNETLFYITFKHPALFVMNSADFFIL
jgi:hypothetical protein